MLLTNRRHRLIYFCLLGMEVAWITPFLLVIYRPFQAWSPLVVFGFLFMLLVIWILALEIVSRYVLSSPRYELSVMAMICFTSLLLVRLIVYPQRGIFDFTWIIHSLQGVVRFEEGFPPELMVTLTNFFVWLRATNTTSRDIDFWNVGLSFRLGMLLLILGGGLLYQLSDLNTLSFLWLYFTFGLTAVALARIDEKSTDTRSTGYLLPINRLAQLLILVGVTVMVTLWLSGFYDPDHIKAVFRWTLPFWRVVGNLILLILAAIFWLIGPVLIWFGNLIVTLFQEIDFSGLSEAIDSFRNALSGAAENGEGAGFAFAIPPWVWTFLRYLGLTAALLVFLALIMLFLERIRPRTVRDQQEAESSEDVTLGGNALKEGLTWLKNTAGLIGRYGVGRQLLAAISAENIYANLCRLARQQGYPRHPSQPPDDYLPILNQAFIGQEAPLARITASYMRVHYGAHSLTRDELTQIRDDYRQIQHAEKRERKTE